MENKLVGIEIDSAIIDGAQEFTEEQHNQLLEVIQRVNNSPLHKLLGYNNEYRENESCG